MFQRKMPEPPSTVWNLSKFPPVTPYDDRAPSTFGREGSPRARDRRMPARSHGPAGCPGGRAGRLEQRTGPRHRRGVPRRRPRDHRRRDRRAGPGRRRVRVLRPARHRGPAGRAGIAARWQISSSPSARPPLSTRNRATCRVAPASLRASFQRSGARPPPVVSSTSSPGVEGLSACTMRPSSRKRVPRSRSRAPVARSAASRVSSGETAARPGTGTEVTGAPALRRGRGV